MAHPPSPTKAPLEDNMLAWLALEIEDAEARYVTWRRQHPKARLDPKLRTGIQQRLINDVVQRLKARIAALEQYLDHPVGRYLVPTAVVGELATRFRQQDRTV